MLSNAFVLVVFIMAADCVVWNTSVAFLPSHSACQLLQVDKQCFKSLPEHVEELCLRPGCKPKTKRSRKRKCTLDAYKQSALQEMIHTVHYAPREYLKRFGRLKRLVLDLMDEELDDELDDELVADGQKDHHVSRGYFSVVSALGVLFDHGTFTELRRLEITVGVYHSGQFKHRRQCSLLTVEGSAFCNCHRKVGAEGKAASIEEMEDWDRPFWFYSWLHQLAFSIIQATKKESLPLLRHVCITDNCECAYFCNCGHGCAYRRPGDPYIAQIRAELGGILGSTACLHEV